MGLINQFIHSLNSSVSQQKFIEHILCVELGVASASTLRKKMGPSLSPDLPGQSRGLTCCPSSCALHVHAHTLLHTHSCKHTHACTHLCMHPYSCKHTHACTYSYTHTYMHTHTCTHLYTHTYMHTHACFSSSSPVPAGFHKNIPRQPSSSIPR